MKLLEGIESTIFDGATKLLGMAMLLQACLRGRASWPIAKNTVRKSSKSRVLGCLTVEEVFDKLLKQSCQISWVHRSLKCHQLPETRVLQTMAAWNGRLSLHGNGCLQQSARVQLDTGKQCPSLSWHMATATESISSACYAAGPDLLL